MTQPVCTEEEKVKVLDCGLEVHRISNMVIDEINKSKLIQDNERWLLLGRVVNRLVDFTYKPMIINYLKEKGAEDVQAN